MKMRGVFGAENSCALLLIEDGCSQTKGSSQMTLPTDSKLQTPPKLAPPAASRSSPCGVPSEGVRFGWEKKNSPKFSCIEFSLRAGIPKNLSSQVLGEVRVNFLE